MSCFCGKKSTPGYTFITNSVAQTWATNGILQPGSILATSSANNISISGSSLVVANTGTYMVDVSIMGTPGTASSTTIPTINVNGTPVYGNSYTGGATQVEGEFNVRAVLSLDKGDVITITNAGASSLTIAAATSPNYNVNIIIERFN